jgi:hypothetical protein
LTGLKAEYDYESDISAGDVTRREVYFEIEAAIN